jgi:hypothetical protein
VALTPEAIPPSPKFQAYEAIVPSVSKEPTALKLTVSGTTPIWGVAVKFAIGGTLIPTPAETTVNAKINTPKKNETIRAIFVLIDILSTSFGVNQNPLAIFGK